MCNNNMAKSLNNNENKTMYKYACIKMPNCCDECFAFDDYGDFSFGY